MEPSGAVPVIPGQRAARVTGLLYLVVVLTGPFILLYVPGKLFVDGDPSATVRNILANPGLFQAKIVVGLIAQCFFLASVLALYRLLQGVQRELAALMAILILVIMPLGFLGLANEVATLTMLRGGDFLAAFDAPQRDALALLLIHVDGLGIPVHEVFWGLWLLPLGTLVYRSGFIPRFLGVWLCANGMAYLALSALRLFVPPAADRALGLATPVLLGEVALAVWLVTVGVRRR